MSNSPQRQPSSLDFDVLADFKGSAAERYQKISRAIQRICVDVCNENDWEIPFTQVTVHQASAASQPLDTPDDSIL